MNIPDLIDKAKKRSPKAFDSISDEQAKAVVRAVFMELRLIIADRFVGRIVLRGFGVFKIRNIERKRGGNLLLRRRVFFRAARIRKKSQNGRAKQRAD